MEAERGNDPARTGAAAHGWFRVHLRDKCGDRTDKNDFGGDRNGWKCAGKGRENEGRAAFTALRSARATARRLLR